MESVTSARFYFTAMCISLYFHWHHWTRESKTIASLQLCHAQLIGVIVLWLLINVIVAAPSLLSDIRAGELLRWAAGACFPVTSRWWVCGADEGSVQAGGGRWLLLTSLGVMAAVIF